MIGICWALALQSGVLSSSPSDWPLVSYGAAPSYVSASVDGRPVLTLSSEQASDAAIAQNVAVEPGEIYTFYAWVKTQDLRPNGSPVYGTIVAQQVRGGNLAIGRLHSGTNSWTEESVTFLAPTDGRVHLAMFLCGWGKGTGTAWFSGMRLMHRELNGVPLKITREPLCPGRISPMQYGQFIEYLCDLVPGMWAEKLYDPSFEGLTPYKFVYLRETDFKEKPWYPYGQTNRFEVVRDKATAVSGITSLRVDLGPGTPSTGGIAQDGVSLNQGVPCQF